MMDVVHKLRSQVGWPEDALFLTVETEFVLFLAMFENSVLPMDLDSSHETLKVTSAVYKRHEELGMTFGVGRHTTLVVKNLL